MEIDVETKGTTLNFISIELIVTSVITLILMLGTFYGGYSVLADDQGEQEKKIEIIDIRHREIQAIVNQINTDVELIKNRQIYFKEEVKEQREDIKYIRQLLEVRYSNGHLPHSK